ncbi:hypothetical protein KNP414_01956 [Paenibacillus mucilaginosus KNP414]|uniref:Uncharacterized protein n=1 Tax=Paenibacillus mucilaginosus (strain KNP414) TaxID=1036673 RepID=F8FRG0_PAEMK|nr:hypothetical protein KNP414_01956 [Paenibacillus mucilaginosus KNP414]
MFFTPPIQFGYSNFNIYFPKFAHYFNRKRSSCRAAICP